MDTTGLADENERLRTEGAALAETLAEGIDIIADLQADRQFLINVLRELLAVIDCEAPELRDHGMVTLVRIVCDRAEKVLRETTCNV